MNKKNDTDEVKEEQLLLTFLEKTKEGKYAQITDPSLLYPRMVEQDETLEYNQDDFIYSVS